MNKLIALVYALLPYQTVIMTAALISVMLVPAALSLP